MEEEYIIHGTTENSLLEILDKGYIDYKVSKNKRTMTDEKHQIIFTQLIYKNLPHQENMIPHWFQFAIVLDKQILKDFSFYATFLGGFNNMYKKDSKEKAIITSPGKLNKYPDMSKLKKYIYTKMNKDDYDKTNFIHSHEILFSRRIYLKRYCKCIIMRIYDKTKTKNSKLYDKIEKIAKKEGISIIKYYFNHENEIGINNFIDIINLKKNDT